MFLVDDLALLGASLAIGLLIGLERGWTFRQAEEGQRLAGIRTFGLIGLLGGCCGILSLRFGGLFLGLCFVGLSVIFSVAYFANLKNQKDISITSMIAAMLTFFLAALATMGHLVAAGSAAVIAAILLSIKPVLHGWIRNLAQEELAATLKLLLISVVLLSILPNQGYGPWEAINPFQVWWMVVLVAAISYVGYFAIKIGGVRKGGLFTAMFAGFASSTALTFHYAKLARDRKDLVSMLSAGMLLASGLMFLRLLLLVGIISMPIFLKVAFPSLVLAFALFIPALIYFFQAKKIATTELPALQNPLELKAALVFGVLLIVVTLLGKWLEQTYGSVGLYSLALIVGLVDIDAFTLSTSRIQTLPTETLAMAIMLAALTNTALKGVLAFIVAGTRVLFSVSLPLMLIMLLGGGMVFWLMG